ncbi:MAG: hypothetical protein QXE51_02740 [Nitrososphaeria archaeon]
MKEKMIISVKVPIELWARMRESCKEKGVTVTEWVTEAITEKMKKEELK